MVDRSSWLTRKSFTTFLNRFPEWRVLSGIAKECRYGLGVRGGLIRGLLLSAVRAQDGEFCPGGDLTAVLGPFSDVDLIVEDEEDWARLQPSVLGLLPHFRFLSCHIGTWRSLRRWSPFFERVPPNRLVAVLGRDGRTRFRGDGMAVGSILAQAASRRFVVLGPRRFSPDWWATYRHLAALRVLRLQNENTDFSFINQADAPEAPGLTRPSGPEARQPGRTARARAEMLVLDAVFTAKDAVKCINQALELCWVPQAPFLGSLGLVKELALRLEASRGREGGGQWLGVMVLPTSGGGPAKMRLVEDQLAAHDNGGKTCRTASPPPAYIRIPWPSRLMGCCYRDFSAGSAVLAWRQLQLGRSPGTKACEYQPCLVAEPIGRGRHDGAAGHLVPVPAIVAKGESWVARFDIGFLGLFADLSREFELSIFPEGIGGSGDDA